MSCCGWWAGETTWPFVMTQPLGLMNQPVPVSRNGGGVICCLPPPGHATVISAATSDTTRATAGFARSKISWTDGAAAAATPGTARNSALAIHLRIVKILYCATYKQKAPGGDPWSLCTATAKIRSLLHQSHRLDGLRLGGVHVPGLARGLGVADQLRRVTARSLGTGERPRSLNVLAATWGLEILTRTRGLEVLTAARRLNVLAAARGLNVLTAARRLEVLAASRGLNVLAATRSLDVLTARSLNVLTATRGLNVLAGTRRLHGATRSLNVLTAARSLDVLTRTRGLDVLARSSKRPRGLNVLGLRNLLQHCLSLADLGRALRLRVGDGRHRRDDCDAHDCREKSLH